MAYSCVEWHLHTLPLLSLSPRRTSRQNRIVSTFQRIWRREEEWEEDGGEEEREEEGRTRGWNYRQIFPIECMHESYTNALRNSTKLNFNSQRGQCQSGRWSKWPHSSGS